MTKNLVSRAEIQQKINALINKKLPAKQAQLAITFAELYFDNVSLADLNLRGPESLCASMLSHWNLIYQRQQGETKIHIYNPTMEQNGWQSTHTVIEISTDDMPFLVDSLQLELNRQGFAIHFMVHLGALKLSRNKQGEATEMTLIEASPDDYTLEAPIYIEIDRESDPAIIEKLRIALLKVLEDVRLSVEDWLKMRKKMQDAIVDIKNNPPPFNADDIAESVAFLQWLIDDHFTFLGCRDYELVKVNGDQGLRLIKGTGLGVLRNEENSKAVRLISSMPPAARELALAEQVLVISKTNTKASIHRPVYTDYIGVKHFDKNGNLIGERRFIGLFTSTAYKSHPKDIPLLRRKIEVVMQNSKLSIKGHSGKELLDILASLPRDDLFQAGIEELTQLAMGILHIQERHRIHLFVRQDAYRRFVSCLVYLPKEHLNTELRNAMQDVLINAFKGLEVTYNMSFTESEMARIDFLIRTDPKVELAYDVDEIESELIEVARSWRDELRDCLLKHYDEEQGTELIRKYLKGFPVGYIEDFSPLIAVHDLEHIQRLKSDDTLEIDLHISPSKTKDILSLKLFRRNEPIILSDALPMLENMGLRVIGEKPYEITAKDGSRVWLHDFTMTHSSNDELDIDKVKPVFQEALLKLWQGEAENDGFNRLVLAVQLSWREAALLRAYAKYLRHIGFTFSQAYIEATLAKNAHIAKQLVELFKLWFDPEHQLNSAAAIPEAEKQLETLLNAVANLDEDRILRRLYEVVRATYRTNYFQKDKEGKEKPCIAFKLNPARIADLPLPKPQFEIFVYSPRVEGIHLRAAKVARGGLRWSDRREDFRVEILGLMKAQQVKNAVIVPYGAKGGFVPKQLPIGGSREAIMEEAIACYKTFIRGLLDVTDNIQGGKIVPPANTVRYDEDDPYLVVAADKGTATFSDIANQISHEYGFWLGDAFASGGSAGYDHKKMGITARGAWESLKRHFRSLNLDPNIHDFTVVGIGDMSGDVFGNGMLLSRHIKLVAAFNHEHIFLDPNPDPEKSFIERERLFKLPRSSWEDYDAKLISKGGGIYKRSAKIIPLSPEIKALFDVSSDFLEPSALIRAALMSKVDLLWNGGIGTYVKASSERHVDVGDRTNDILRINGNQLRCRVVVEGGNLGFTQLGRIEYALNNGLIYTDFIDNSAGVDCSDHEVNCKILLNEIVDNGDITVKQRNEILLEMTDDIAKLVLHDNYCQTRAINLIGWRAIDEFWLHRGYIEELERNNRLDRVIEFLPDDKGFLERKAQNKGLTSPELAVLLAYSKMYVKAELLASDVFEDNYLSKALETEFSPLLQQRFYTQMEHHRLRKEIIATQLSSSMINDIGFVPVYRMQTEMGASIPSIVRAYVIAQKIFGMHHLLEQIEKLDCNVSSQIQNRMMWEVIRLIRRAVRWFLRSRQDYLIDIPGAIADFKDKITEMSGLLPDLQVGSEREHWDATVKEYRENNVPIELAIQIASIRAQYSLLDIIAGSVENDLPLKEFTAIYFLLGETLELSWLRDQITQQATETYWEALARTAIRDDLDAQQYKLTIAVMQSSDNYSDLSVVLDKWCLQHDAFTKRWQQLLANLRASTELKHMMFSVVVRELIEQTRTQMRISSDSRPKRVKRK